MSAVVFAMADPQPRRYLALDGVDDYTIRFVDGPSLAYVEGLEARIAALESGQEPEPEPDPWLPLWGAAVGGNSDPTSFEATMGNTIGVRRTYWNSGDTTSAVATAASDAAAGRVPWMSFKLGVTWEQAANGDADAWAQDLASQMGDINGLVMLTFHHEPEGDEPSEAAFVAMHDRLYTFTQPYDNIRCGPVLTGWTTLYSGNPEYALDTMWPGQFNSGDFIGFDGYNYYGCYDQQGTYNAGTDTWTPQPGDERNMNPNSYRWQSDYYYEPLAAWAKSKGTKWAIGEFGFSGYAAQYDIDRYGEVRWLQDAWDSAADLGDCLALAYFNSPYHSRTDWRVESDPDRLAAYRAVLAQSPQGVQAWP